MPLKNKDFEVQFQPIFDLGNGALARMESFVRWRHGSLGVLPPGAFISFFESQGRMSELTRYVLAQALSGYSEWRGPYAPGFSINLALTDLSDEAFATHFTKLLRDNDFPADLVTLECPMPPVDADLDQAAENFARLRETGARLAIEVRGRANDFLRNIDPFPFDEIKTGGASILRFARTVRGPGLSAISDLLDVADKSNAIITAVGVEDQASLAALRGLGFTAAQGNHLSTVGSLSDFRPGRVNEVRELLDLPPLSSEDLTALFRTEAPKLKAAEVSDKKAETAEPEDALLERLNERVEAQAQNVKTQEAKPAAKEQQAEQAQAPVMDEAKRAAAKERARKIALAKRAKARELRKLAAIKRARAKAAAEAQQADTDGPEAPASAEAAPRSLQDRLEKEFASKPSKEEKQASTEQDQKPAAQSQPDATDKSVEEPVSAPVEPPAEQAATPNVQRELSLKIKGAQAFFRPGISVGGEPIGARMETTSMQREAAQGQARVIEGAVETSPDLFETTPVEVEAEKQDEAVSEAAAPEAAASDKAETPSVKKTGGYDIREALGAATPLEPEPEKVTAEQPAEVVQGHLHEDPTTEETVQVDAPKTRKNFLQRKYKVMPTHFWPKRWKKAYRRWKHEQAEAKAEQSALAD